MMKSITMQPKLWFLCLAVATSTLLLSACAAQPFQTMLGINNVVTQEIDIQDFEEVEVDDAFAVQIRQGDEFQVKVEVDRASRRDLQVTKSGDTLKIGLRSRFDFFSWNMNRVLRAEVTMPTLVGIRAHDASQIDVSGFSTSEEVRVEVSDASTLRGEFDTGDTWLTATDSSKIVLDGKREDIEVEAEGASDISLRGEGRNATLRAWDASRVNLAEFPIQDATIEASDASRVTVDAKGTIDAQAIDASEVIYYGEPSLGTIRTEDDSSVAAR